MRRNKKKRIIIISLIGILLLMTAGYAAFQTNLDIKGTSKVSSNWNVLITNVTESNKEGEAETVGTPSWTDLTAYMEANLYQKGDFVEYDVTVENRGTLDAKLDDITDNIKSSNDAVKISFSGYTKGEKLYKNTNKIIKVKIEYNPEFTGTIEEGSSEVSVDLNYTQAEGGTVTPTDKYLVTYDCTSNGGDNCSSYNEYLNEGETVNLSKTATKEGFKFIGWNTNKEATEALTELSMLNENITLYAIFKDVTPPECELTVTKATIDTVTIKADCKDVSGIKEYQYSINDETYNVSSNNTYEFNSFDLSTIKVQAVDNVGNQKIFQISETNLQEGYQTIYDSLNDGYKDLKTKKDNYKNNLLNKTYPIGSIYITTENTNPSEILGGTWEAYSQGRSLVGVNLNDVNFNEVNKIGGSKTSTLAVTNLPSHTHSIPALSGSAASAGAHTHSIPALSGTAASAGSHNHDWKGYVRVAPIASETYVQAVFGKDSTDSYINQGKGIQSAGAHTHTVTTTASTTGSNGAHTHNVTTTANNTGSTGSGISFTNLQPYITVYMWKRVS